MGPVSATSSCQLGTNWNIWEEEISMRAFLWFLIDGGGPCSLGARHPGQEGKQTEQATRSRSKEAVFVLDASAPRGLLLDCNSKVKYTLSSPCPVTAMEHTRRDDSNRKRQHQTPQPWMREDRKTTPLVHWDKTLKQSCPIPNQMRVILRHPDNSLLSFLY